MTKSISLAPTPVTIIKQKTNNDTNVVSYASILTKEPIQEPIINIPILKTLELNIAMAQTIAQQTVAQQTVSEKLATEIQFPAELIGKKIKFCKNWADATDSDDEE